MTTDVSSPFAAGDPVAAALKDPQVLERLDNTARAVLGPRARGLSASQVTAEVEVIRQEALKRAWVHRERFDPAKGDPGQWLNGFVAKVACEVARSRRRGVAGATVGVANLDTATAAPDRPVDDTVADRLLVKDLLAQLPPIDRDILCMKHQQDMTYAEIGQRVGMNENAVRVRAFRAVRTLNAKYTYTGEERP